MLLAFLCILHFNGILSIPTGNNILRNGGTSDSQTKATGEGVVEFNELLNNLPQHLSLHPHQAGGHLFNSNGKIMGTLKDSRGYILKKVEKNELDFYKEVQNGFYPKLVPLIPAFHGTVSVPFRNQSVEFIALEDLTNGFEKPCVLDVKIGERTWGPDATEEKIMYEKRKFTASKEVYGFSIPGYVVIDPISNKKTRFDKDFFKHLNVESIVPEIERFVHITGNYEATAILVRRIIEELKKIQEWASTQKEFRLYASSIIIVYDSQALLSLVPDECFCCGLPLTLKKRGKSPDFVRVKMIDFAHSYKTPEPEGIDTNYLRGIDSLLKVFQDILSNCTYN